jgi:hypothetical protein
LQGFSAFLDTLQDRGAARVTTELVEEALSDVANAIERVCDEARKTHRQRKRELKRHLRG